MGVLAFPHARLRPALVAILGAANLALGAALASSHALGVLLGLLPLALLLAGSLVASNRALLVYAGLLIGLADPLPLSRSWPVGPLDVYPSDVIVLLAVASWVLASLLGPRKRRTNVSRPWLFGWPLALFAAALAAALVRGHVRYGTSLVSLPVRFVVYAGIVLAFTGLAAGELYRGLVAVFYAGTLWQAGVAAHDLAAGTAATHAVGLSTGGDRVLAGSTAIFMCGSLLFALLNLDRDRRARGSVLHVAIAGLATFALVVTFQRTTFALVALLVPVALLVFRRAGARALALLPLVAPFLALAVLLVPRADPTLFPTLRDRLVANPRTDTSAIWREHAIAAVWSQVKEAPVTGVGFGRHATFTLDGVTTDVGQDPHDQYLYLWAGGGLLLLGSFVLLLLGFVGACVSRFRPATGDERRLVFWVASLWFVLIVNSASGIILTTTSLLLMFWILMAAPVTLASGRSRRAPAGAPVAVD